MPYETHSNVDPQDYLEDSCNAAIAVTSVTGAQGQRPLTAFVCAWAFHLVEGADDVKLKQIPNRFLAGD